MAFNYTTIGFVGLGVMGYPMVENLAQKLPSDAQIFVYDVSSATLDKIAAAYPNRVHVCSSAKEVTDSSVRESTIYKESANSC
jgi:3-hydroxyisobutyrate dehydrogenase